MTRPTGRSTRSSPRPGETIADAVARVVREQIFDGRLVAGQRLPQDDIADTVGVSRIPVREAIIALEREGWVRVERHRGAFVNPFDDRAVLDRFALYGRLHGFAATRAVQRMSQDELLALGDLANRVTRVSGPKPFERANSDYMAALVSMSGSSRLRGVMRSTAQIVPGNFFVTVPNSVAIQRDGVAALQAALDGRDANAAVRICESIEDQHAVEVIAIMNQRREALGVRA